MGPVTKVLLLLAVVVPVTGYVAGSLVSPGLPAPADHSPVILHDSTPATTETSPRTPGTTSPAPADDGDRRSERSARGGGDRPRVLTPQPTPLGEDGDDDWDDDGPDDDETDDDRDDDRDDEGDD